MAGSAALFSAYAYASTNYCGQAVPWFLPALFWGAVIFALGLPIIGLIAFFQWYIEWRKTHLGLTQVISRFFRSLRYWHQYQPSWSIEKVADIEVYQATQISYFMLMPLYVRYTNHDPRYPLSFTSSPTLHIYHAGKGRDGRTYKLRTANHGTLLITSDHHRIILHCFSVALYCSPLLSGIIKCKINGINRASKQLPIGEIKGKIKMVGKNTFNVTAVFKTGQLAPPFLPTDVGSMEPNDET